MANPDELSVLADATRYLSRNALLVRDADLSAPTPCGDWDLSRLLRHIHTSLAEVTDVLAVRELDGGPASRLRPTAPRDPVAALHAGIVDVLLTSTSLSTAGRWCDIWDRSLPAKIVVYVAAIEMALHAWDIAQACLTDRPIPTDLASALLEVSPPLAKAGAAGHVFAEPLAVPTTATPGEQLLALFGRRRRGAERL